MTKIGDRYIVVGEVDFDKLTEEENECLRQTGCITPDGFLIVPESHFGSTVTMFMESGPEAQAKIVKWK